MKSIDVSFWGEALLAGRDVSAHARLIAGDATFVPLIQNEFVARIGRFRTLKGGPVRFRLEESYTDPEEMPKLVDEYEMTPIEANAEERHERTTTIHSAIKVFGHQAVEGLPNVFVAPEVVFLGRAAVAASTNQFPPSVRDTFSRLIADTLMHLVARRNEQDYVIASVIDPPDDVGYIQFKAHKSGKFIWAESESRMYKESKSQAVAPFHEEKLAWLGWRHHWQIPNDFGLFETPTPEAIALLGVHAMETLIAVHGLLPQGFLTVDLVDFDGLEGGKVWAGWEPE